MILSTLALPVEILFILCIIDESANMSLPYFFLDVALKVAKAFLASAGFNINNLLIFYLYFLIYLDL